MSLYKGEVPISISLLLPPFCSQDAEWRTLLKWNKIAATWFIGTYTICQSLRFTCLTSLDLLLIMLMIDYCLSHLDQKIKLI